MSLGISSWNLPKEHETGLEDGYLLLLSTIRMA